MENKLSFGLEKIELIDMLMEDDDDFLVASPFQHPFSDAARESTGFRISDFRTDDLDKLPRPSFHRRSLAWDSAFFDSPGVLDPDELSCINKEFRTTKASRWRDESESRPNNDAGFCGEWFEIEPSIHKPKPCKMPKVANRAVKSIDISARNESTARRIRHGTVSSPKPPMASGRNIPTRSKLDVSGKSNAKTKNICSTSPATSVAGSSIGIAPNPQTLTHLKTRTQTLKSRIRGSLSSSMVWRRGDRNTNSPSIGRGPSEPLSSSVDKNKPEARGLKTDLEFKKTMGVLMARKEKNEANHKLQSSVSTPPNHYSGRYSVGSLWDKRFGLSGLRRPSPQIGFFDENTSPTPRYHEITRNRKLPQGVLPEGSSAQLACSSEVELPSDYSCPEKLRRSCPKSAQNIKRPKLADHVTSSSLVHQSLKPTKKKSLAAADQENRSEHPINLSECFAAIDLNRENNSTTRRLIRKRAPLADKTSSCNYPCTLRYEK